MMHLAENREKAKRDLQFGLEKWVDYSRHVLPASPFPDNVDDPITWGIENKLLLVGTPEDVIHEIERVQELTGGFGVFLCFANNFAPWEATKNSYEMFARYVIPYFRGSNNAREESYGDAKASRDPHQERRHANLGLPTSSKGIL